MWLLPTLNRIHKLHNFLTSAMVEDTCTPGLILVDKDDFEANRAGYDSIKDTHLDVMRPLWRYRVTRGITMGEKVREVWNEIKDRNWVGILNDDHHIVTKHWDKKLLAKLDGKNFVSANDRWVAPRKATTATVWSMPLLECVGWPIFPPGLQHLFIDDVWEHLGRATGCWRPVMSVVVEHHHVINGRGKEDDTHHKVYNQKAWDMDNAVFQNFMKHDFESTVQKIRALQDRSIVQKYRPLDVPSHNFVPTGINMD